MTLKKLCKSKVSILTDKTNCITKMHYEHQRNTLVGYLMPIPSYGWQAWYLTKCQIKDMDRIFRAATKWMVHQNIQYKEKLSFSLSLTTSKFMICSTALHLSTTVLSSIPATQNRWNRQRDKEQRARGLNSLQKFRLQGTEKNFFQQSKRLANLIKKTPIFVLDMKLITHFYWSLFNSKYNLENTCTWRIRGHCGHCNPHNIIATAMNFAVGH